MAKAAQEDETLELPEGGIAAFVMSDEDADAIYGPDDDGTEEFGNNGIAQFPALTKKMAAMGREGDNTLAHVETGELIIPAVFLKDDPQMKETLFAFLERQGVENPERYVVGSDENSINPNTGAPEFFFKFIKKAVKGVVKGVKNVIKGVVKVVKKIAPIVLPIVLGTFGPLGAIYGSALGSGIGTLISGGSLKDALKAVVKVVKKIAPVVLPIALGMTPLGAIYGAALGSGIGTLISGGSLKDALKSGVMAGITGGIIKGFTGPGKFMQNISAELAAPTARLGQFATGTGNTLQSLGSKVGLGTAPAADAPGMFSKFTPTADLLAQDTFSGRALSAVQPDAIAANQVDALKPPKTGVNAEIPEVKSFGTNLAEGNIKDAFFPKGPTATDFLNSGATTSVEVAKQMAADAAPKFLRSYLPMAAAGTAVAGAAGAFEVPEQEEAGVIGRDEDGNPITGSTLVEDDPSKYLIADLGNIVLNPETGQYETKSTYTPPDIQAYDATAFQMSNENPFSGGQPGFGSVSTATGPFARPSVAQFAAKGGEIFPRRTGGIMPNEGVPNKDSVRAMLMPGEFVMTTDAVKGLGNGNMQQGIQNMYSVMSKLENRGRQTA